MGGVSSLLAMRSVSCPPARLFAGEKFNIYNGNLYSVPQHTLDKFFEQRSKGRGESRYISHPLLVEGGIEAREYQLEIAGKAKTANTLVVLPTGLGKTVVSILVAVEAVGEGKVLFLAPTKPLVHQHFAVFKKFTRIEPLAAFTGEVSQAKRKELWREAEAIFSTPQAVLRDINSQAYSLDDVALLIFDEAHRTVGGYAYVEIARCFSGLILALTASPGGEKERISEVMKNLKVRAVEARASQDEDVREYVKGIDLSWEKVALSPELLECSRATSKIFEAEHKKLKRMGFLTHRSLGRVSKKDLIELGNSIRKRMAKGQKGYLFGAIYSQSICLHSFNLQELVETQGAEPALAYLLRLESKEKKSRAEKAIIKRTAEIKGALEAVNTSHPKLEVLAGIVSRQLSRKQDPLIIVFVQYRDTIKTVQEALEQRGIKTLRFVGQASRGGEKGMSQKLQAEALESFRRGEDRVLVASSVAEEGLDIPSVDLVVFYEPVPSEIRAIQRRGRTGRSSLGRVVILLAEGTKDEAYFYAERARERKMESFVRWLSRQSRF